MVSAYARSARQSWQMRARLTQKSCSITIVRPLSAFDFRAARSPGQASARRPPLSGMVRNLVLMIRRRKADDFDRPHDQIFRGPMAAEDGLAKSRPDRCGRFLAASAAGDVLWVRP